MSGLKVNPETLKIEGEDVLYENFSGTQIVRVCGFYRDRKTQEKMVICASAMVPGGKFTMKRLDFEREFAEKLSPLANRTQLVH